MAGPYGCGKTMTLKACYRWVQRVRFELWPRFWPRPPETFSCNWAEFVHDVSEKGADGRLEDLHKADIVFLDDIGAEEDRFRSGAPARILGDVLGRLHDNKKRFLVTTNVAVENWRTHWGGRVEDRLIRADAMVMDLKSVSYAAWRLERE